MADTLKVIQTSHGKPMLVKNGYLFRFVTFGLQKRIWECERRRHGGCPVRIHTTESLTAPNQLSNDMGTHNHNANAINCEIKETITNIRKDATSSTDSPAHVIARNVRHASSAAQGALPLSRNLKRGVRKVRASDGGSLVIPHRRQDINLPATYQKTASGDAFVLFDSGADNNRILIFSTQHNMEFLKACDVWLVDGTFKTAPALFEQLFVVHGWRNGVTFPLVYCLTPNRTTPTYVRMLSALKVTMPDLAPTTIMSDYEMASINAFAGQFPAAEQKGCFFHFSQCIFRHIRQQPDLHQYSTDSDFSLQIWHMVALAFVPPEDVIATFDHLMEQDFFVQNEALLTDFITYFERTWLGTWNRRRTAQIPALFAIPLWNCFHSVLEDLPKTNNACEGFHHAFSNLLGAIHPTIFKLIDGMKEKQILTELDINQYRAGNVPPPIKKYQVLAKELKKVVEEYGSPDFSHIDYLRRIAYRIRVKD